MHILKLGGARIRAIFFFAILAILSSSAAYAQEVQFSVRDAMMLMAVEQLMESQPLPASEIPFSSREEVISSAINRLEESQEISGKPIEKFQVARPKSSKKGIPGVGLINSYLKKVTSRLHPYLSAQANFNDNADNSGKKRSSLGYSTSAGMRGSYITKGRNSFNIDAFMRNAYQERHAESNTQDLTVNSQFNFGVKRNTFSVANSYFTNYIADDDFGIKVDQLKQYWSDTLSLSWGKHFNRIGFDVGGAHSVTNYEDDYNTMDISSDSFGIAQYLFIGRKTRLSLGYYYKRTTNDRVPAEDTRTDSFSLELAGVVSPKITGAFNIGYDLLNIKVGRDTKTRDFGLSFAYRISNRSNLSLNLGHSIYDDSYAAANYYTDDTFSLSGKHRLAFNPRLSISFTNSVRYMNYHKLEGAHNNSITYGMGLGLTYAFRQWLDLSLSWAHTRLCSKISTDYNANAVTFSSSARF
jgi:hypothetical protein